jgi:hypothetical protein
MPVCPLSCLSGWSARRYLEMTFAAAAPPPEFRLA